MNTHSKNGDVRIGFYVCHCGSNIAAMVDCPGVAQYVSKLPGVVVSRDYKYMCSDPGQELIQPGIKEHQRNRLVVAAVARTHLPQRRSWSRSESVLFPDGQHSRA